MKVVADTNVLIRSVVRDDKTQARAADRALKQATVIAITLPVLCEFVWVLRSVYALAPADIAAAIRTLLDIPSVSVNRPAVEAGLALLTAGGDFADGVIAYKGQQLGGEIFVSFDKQAASLLSNLGISTSLLNR